MLAGWLREEASRKLVVDCARKGVVFVEADVDIAVARLSNTRCPPFLFFKEFIDDNHVYRASASPLGLLLAAVADKPLVSMVRQTPTASATSPCGAPLHQQSRPCQTQREPCRGCSFEIC